MTVIEDDPDRHAVEQLLTVNGALFVDQVTTVLTARLIDWNLGDALDLGFADSVASIGTAGRWAIWSDGAALHLRDLVERDVSTLSGSAGNWRNSVAAGGQVAFWGAAPDYQIYFYDGTSTTQLTSDPVLWSSYPVTDGQSVIYRKSTPCCGGPQIYGIHLHDGTREIVLADHGEHAVEPEVDYQLAAGWAAFTRPDGLGMLQAWVRSPAGDETRLSFFGEPSSLRSLGPDGKVVFASDGRLYAASPREPFPPHDIGSSILAGHTFWEDGRLYRVVGGELFAVEAFLDVFDDGFESGNTSAWTLTVP